MAHTIVMRLGFSIVERARVRVGVGERVCVGAMTAQKRPYRIMSPIESPYVLRSEPCTGLIGIPESARNTARDIFVPRAVYRPSRVPTSHVLFSNWNISALGFFLLSPFAFSCEKFYRYLINKFEHFCSVSIACLGVYTPP
jgi:hypothetical protein